MQNNIEIRDSSQPTATSSHLISHYPQTSTAGSVGIRNITQTNMAANDGCGEYTGPGILIPPENKNRNAEQRM